MSHEKIEALTKLISVPILFYLGYLCGREVSLRLGMAGIELPSVLYQYRWHITMLAVILTLWRMLTHVGVLLG